MLPLRDRPYIHGERPGLRHVSWFLSAVDKPAFHKAQCDLVPNNFSEVPALMAAATKRSLVLAAVAPPDEHGYFSLGTHAEYVAAMIGEVAVLRRGERADATHRSARTSSTSARSRAGARPTIR